MIRLFIILLLFAPPLLAVNPEFDTRVAHGLKVESAEVRIHIRPGDDDPAADVTVEFALFNEADELDETEEIEFELVLPARLIPEDQRAGFALTGVDTELADTELTDDEFRCAVTMRDNQRLTVRWSWAVTVTRLPNEHPLGRRMVRVPLSYVTEFVSLPERLDVRVGYSDLPDELFGRDTALNGQTIDAGVPVDGRFNSFEFRFLAHTLDARRRELARRVDAYTDSQRTADNRSYTDTLVLLSELQELAGDVSAYAGTCATLAGLEAESGKVISHCGPWARWRKYIPWALKCVAANRAAGGEIDAESAKAAVQDRWAAYVKARDTRRPFDNFDVVRFGSYWDYDWARTGELYAQVLEILGEEDAAADVRSIEESDE